MVFSNPWTEQKWGVSVNGAAAVSDWGLTRLPVQHAYLIETSRKDNILVGYSWLLVSEPGFFEAPVDFGRIPKFMWEFRSISNIVE